MKNEGILDDIEKIVDDFSVDNRKQINNSTCHKFSWEESFKGELKRENARLSDFQRQFVNEWYYNEHVRHEKREYDRMLRRRYEQSRLRVERTNHKCRCGLEIEIYYEARRVDIISFDDRAMERYETDWFCCPKCREQIRVVGKLFKISVNLMG